ncbi:MAG: hypothetical protein AB7C97_07060 [Oscillospiraceae bacterium]
MNHTIYDYMMLFLIYSFLGWCCEVVYAAVNHGKFVNRGFLNGPICPIYGFGVIAVIFCLEPVSGSLVLLFIGSVLLTSTLEFVTGYILEKAFHDKWWDYSENPVNIKGYICLKFSLMWGFACVFVIRIIHPIIEGVVIKLPDILTYICLIVFGTVFTADVVITVIGVSRFPKRMKSILELERSLNFISEEIGMELTESVFSAKEKEKAVRKAINERAPELEQSLEKYRELLSRRDFVHKRLLNAFPRLQNGKYEGAVRKLRLKKQR